MGNYLTPEQIAEQLDVQPKTVRDWLRTGALIGIKIGKSWRVDPKDLERLIEEKFFEARMARAARVHSDIDWERGQCTQCGILMPKPHVPEQLLSRNFVCTPECKVRYDNALATILDRNTEEFAMGSAQVVPQY
jgi:excisionase family DNA binding protein